MATPRQQVTPATTATARPRRSCSGRRYRAPFCSGFAATASWKTRASSGGGGSSCGGRDRWRRPNRRRPELGHRLRRCYGVATDEPMGVFGSWEHLEPEGVLRRELGHLWPRRCHGRRRGALGKVVRRLGEAIEHGVRGKRVVASQRLQGP